MDTVSLRIPELGDSSLLTHPRFGIARPGSTGGQHGLEGPSFHAPWTISITYWRRIAYSHRLFHFISFYLRTF